MTTWELAGDEEKQVIESLMKRLRRAGIELPPFPATADHPTLNGLTKRDAGVLTTRLRESLADAREGPR